MVLLNKPYSVLCQFSRDGSTRLTLADFIDIPGVYPAGRLDADSEGLVVLTSDGVLQARITAPSTKLPKLYWVQVEGDRQPGAIAALRAGLMLADGPTRPARVQWIDEPHDLWPRVPAIRARRAIPTHWLAITLTEGRNRQVRRMTAAVGLPTLRLIRAAIGPWQLGGLQPGEWRTETIPPGVL